MVIMTKQAVLFMDRKTGREFRAPNGFIGKCPDWVAETRQFKEMVADGMIVATESTKDKDLETAANKAGKKGKNGKGGKKPETVPEDPGADPEEPEDGTGEPKTVPESESTPDE